MRSRVWLRGISRTSSSVTGREKEALLKATGKGLSGGLKNFCTAGRENENSGDVISTRPDVELTEHWRYFDCPAPQGILRGRGHQFPASPNRLSLARVG